MALIFPRAYIWSMDSCISLTLWHVLLAACCVSTAYEAGVDGTQTKYLLGKSPIRFYYSLVCIVTNMELARMTSDMSDNKMELELGPYEPGEIVNGKPISFNIEGESLLWKPIFMLKNGVARTLEWFRQNLSRYI